MFKYLTQKWKQKRGFTLMEVMVVVAILAVIAGIAIPSVINMRKNMKFQERNDYAKAIFMAAQANLTEMRSMGELELLSLGLDSEDADEGADGEEAETDDDSAPAISFALQQTDDQPGTPPPNYYYISKNNATYYDLVLPANTVESSIRDEQVIIEFNPKAGIVYSVFFYDESDIDIIEDYENGKLIRDEDARKEDAYHQLGYYSVGSIDELEAAALNVCHVSPSMTYSNAADGTITITVPILDEKANNIFTGDVLGASESEYTHLIAGLEVALTVTSENGSTSFTTKIKGTEPGTRAKFNATSVHAPFAIDVIFTLDSLLGNTSFTDIIENKNETNTGTAITLGDNVTITADLTYYPTAKDPIVMIESSTIAGVNPLYHSLTQNPDYTESNGQNPYILAISNARHLQNLRHLDGEFAQKIESIVFVAQTEEEVSNTPAATDPSTDPSESSEENKEIAIDWTDAPVDNFTPITFDSFNNDHAIPKIIGNGVKISNLKIEKAANGNTGSPIGLFAELDNAEISGITLVDPSVTNNSVFLSGSATSSAATTGALIGTAENVTIADCNIVRNTDGSAISGKQFVGGLVGYVKGTSSFTNCSVDGIPVTDIGKNPQQDDKITYQLGGMVGYVEGSATDTVTFTNCDTTAKVTATTASDLGGMVGKAVNAKFDGCSTEAEVTGADSILSNIGGLVGYAKDTLFSNSQATGANVKSGKHIYPASDNTKNTVGGLVGKAEGTAANKAKFTNCSVSASATVLSNVNTHSDIGGFIGHADNVTFSSCSSNASVMGSQQQNSEGTPINDIPNNNLGGFIGNSLNCEYDDIDVTLTDRPEYAMDAGGFAGILKGGKVNDLVVNLNYPSGNDAPNVNTITLFGGISSRCNGGAVVTDAGVTIKGTINNIISHAAGAFAVTGGDSSATLSDIRVNLTEATIASAQTAGLIVDNGSNSSVEESYVCGNVSGDSSDRAGFVFQNGGSITQCLANVTMSQGYAFVTVNNSTIKNCYGWIWDKTNAVELEIDKNCSYSYFVNGETDEMVMYEELSDGASQKSSNIKDTAALADPWAVILLNAGTASGTESAWSEGSDGYDYPELSIGHVGKDKDPVVNGDYDYSIVYTEKYEDDSEGTYTISSKNSTPIGEHLDDSEKIISTSYLIYCRSGQLDNISSAFTEETYNGTNDIPRLYSRYTQKAGEHFTGTIEINGDTIALNTYCAPGGRIRTGEQFANINKATGSDFTIERSITLSSSYSSFDYSGEMSAASGAIIDASAISDNLIGTLKGTLSGLKVSGLTEPMVGEISGGTVTGCDVSGKIESGENVGIIAGTLSSGSITDCVVSGSVTGSGYAGGVVGRSAGTIKNVTATLESVSSSDTNKTGALVGYASAGTILNCNVSVSNGTIPPFVTLTPKESIDKDAQYFSRTNHIPSNSDDNITRLYLGNSLSWAPISEANFATYSSDVTISGCKLNNTSIPIGFVYYYKMDENLQCSTPSKAMDFIVMDEKDPQFDTVATNETQYYVHISDDTYKVIKNVHIEDRTVTTGEGESEKEETVHDFYYTVEGDENETVIKGISKSSKVSSANLKLYKKSVHAPDKGTYMVFDAQGNQILIHNENGYQWQDYTTQYYAHMIWRYEEGVLTNMYKPDSAECGTINVGEAAGLITVTLSYNGTEKICRLYPVDAYRNVELVDSAVVLDTSVLTK